MCSSSRQRTSEKSQAPRQELREEGSQRSLMTLIAREDGGEGVKLSKEGGGGCSCSERGVKRAVVQEVGSFSVLGAKSGHFGALLD